MNLIGRKAEKEWLQQYFSSKDPEFIVIYGRRRVGKTYLVKEFFRDDFFFYFTGVAKSSLSLQLKRFGKALDEQFQTSDGKPRMLPPKNWMEAFDCLRYAIKASDPDKRKVIFLDELPWLDTPKSGFVQALEYFWNSFSSTRKDILLIACGSASSWIVQKLFDDTGGLHNRVTGKLQLRPFSLKECEEYLREKNVIIDRQDIVEAYMIFGGIPYYLHYWNPKYSLPQNIDRMLFYEDAPLKDEFENMFSSLFKNSERYIETIRALAIKSSGMTRDELLDTLHIEDGGTFSEILKNLELSSFIRRYPVFPGNKTRAVYQLVDNFSLFHETFMREERGLNEHVWSDLVETPKLNSWRGYSFEQVCLRHVDVIKAALSIGGVSASVFAWRSKDSKPGAQIDLVIDRADRVINLCEIKFFKYEYEMRQKDVDSLKNKRRAFEAESKTRKNIHLTLISTYGLKRNNYATVIQSEVTMDDLFAC